MALTHTHQIDEELETWHQDSFGRNFGHEEHGAALDDYRNEHKDNGPAVTRVAVEHTHDNVDELYNAPGDYTLLDYGTPEDKRSRYEGDNDRRSGEDRRGSGHTAGDYASPPTSTTDGSDVTQLPVGAAASNVATDSMVTDKEVDDSANVPGTENR